MPTMSESSFCGNFLSTFVFFFCYSCKDDFYLTRGPDTLRFPRAADEPPRANALRGLTEASPPAGVYVYPGRLAYKPHFLPLTCRSKQLFKRIRLLVGFRAPYPVFMWTETQPIHAKPVLYSCSALYPTVQACYP